MLISLSVWVLFLGFQSRKIYPLYKSIATNFNFSHSSNLPIFQSLLGLYCSLWIAVLEFQSHSLPHSPNTQDSNGFQHYFVCFVHDQLKSITSFYDVWNFILSSDHTPDNMDVLNILQCDCNMVKLAEKIQNKKTLTFRKSAKEQLKGKCWKGKKWNRQHSKSVETFSPAQENKWP